MTAPAEVEAEADATEPAKAVPRYAYVVFQGGGAAGVVHVGALRALQALGIQPLGVAGASAGAIVAALVAAGYGPDAIVARDARCDWNIFRRNQESPIFLLGNHDWLLLRLLLPLLLVSLAVGQLGTLALLVAAGSVTWLASRIIFLRGGMPAPLRLLVRLAWFPSARGRDFLEMLLSRALDAANPRWRTRDQAREAPFVRFIDLIDDRFLPLRVIATDIDSGRMQVFDATRTPFHSVADAVIASMSIPLVFPPARVREDRAGAAPGPRFVDGGLLSNLPVAALASQRRSSERLLGLRIPIIAFAIEEPGSHKGEQRLWIWRYLPRVLRTGIFGSQAEALALIPGVIVVKLATDIELTRFDLDRTTAQDAIADAEDRAKRVLSWRLVERPQAASAALAAFAAEVRKGLDPADAGAHLRASLYRLTDDEELAVAESWNREADADAVLSLGGFSPVARAVVAAEGPAHVVVKGLGPDAMFMRADEHRLLPDWLHGQLGFPIFTDSGGSRRLAGLLLVEADRSLEAVLGNEVRAAGLQGRAQGMAPFLADAPPEAEAKVEAEAESRKE
ncbi:MAG: patatin-like phospholipase family protein [Thermaurantiacus tibetensis]|uniref:patatin-like phospholipase family protein n=1 Tax=Thermaurantiacus tibetensis TaxID=2759035 RepID=UPI00188F6C4E|nr:patatin-like phospholipase family protein [Thermaurantiacus tibetensis]